MAITYNGRAAPAAKAAFLARARKPVDTLSQATKYALSRAQDALAKFKSAEQTGDTVRIAVAKGEMAMVMADLERAKANETATVLMKSALQTPMRIF